MQHTCFSAMKGCITPASMALWDAAHLLLWHWDATHLFLLYSEMQHTCFSGTLGCMHHTSFFSSLGCCTPICLVLVDAGAPTWYSWKLHTRWFETVECRTSFFGILPPALMFVFCCGILLWCCGVLHSYLFIWCGLWRTGEGGAQLQHRECLLAQHWQRGRPGGWDASQRARRITAVGKQLVTFFIVVVVYSSDLLLLFVEFLSWRLQ